MGFKRNATQRISQARHISQAKPSQAKHSVLISLSRIKPSKAHKPSKALKGGKTKWKL